MRTHACLAAVATVLSAFHASAARVEYTIDPARSFVSVLSALGTDSFQPRSVGSSTRSFQGAFFGELEGDELTIEGANARDTANSFGEPGVPPAFDLIAQTFQGDAFLSILSIT